MRALLPAFALLWAAGCILPGPEHLVGDDNVEVLVTGTAPGDRLVLVVDGDDFPRTVGSEDVVRFSLRLDVGAHPFALEARRRGDRRCARFVVDVTDASTKVVRSVDLDEAVACEALEVEDAGPSLDPDAGAGDVDGGGVDPGDQPDAGVLRAMSRVRESVITTGCAPPCEAGTRVTTLTASGDLIVQQGTTAESAEVSEAEMAELVDALLSPAADALFSGADASCQPTAGAAAVQLERQLYVFVDGEPELVLERIDATECTNPIATAIRAELEELRASAFESP